MSFWKIINVENPRFVLFLIFFAVVLMFPYINVFNLRGEEALRLIPSWEMFKRGDWINLTYLGEFYYNKPPFFYWMTIISSKIVGWQELTVRILSILSTVLIAFGVFLFSNKLFQNKKMAVLSSLIFVTFLDVWFWYGWIGEIDISLTLFVFIMMASQYLGFSKNSSKWIIFSGFMAGIVFLFKGFPSYLFYGLTFLGLSIYFKRFWVLFRSSYLVAYLLAIIIPMLWIINTLDPWKHIEVLFRESFMRAEEGKNIGKFVKHLLMFPLENIKQTLPASIFLLYLIGKQIYSKMKNKVFMVTPEELKAFGVILAINYIPYYLSAGSHGRYLLPLFPFVAVIAGYYIYNASEKVKKVFVLTLFFFFILKGIQVFVIAPAMIKKSGLIKNVAADMMNYIHTDKKIACSCEKHKAVCFWIDVFGDTIVAKPSVYPDWTYLITCTEYKEGNLIKSYKYRKDTIELRVK